MAYADNLLPTPKMQVYSKSQPPGKKLKSGKSIMGPTRSKTSKPPPLHLPLIRPLIPQVQLLRYILSHSLPPSLTRRNPGPPSKVWLLSKTKHMRSLTHRKNWWLLQFSIRILKRQNCDQRRKNRRQLLSNLPPNGYNWRLHQLWRIQYIPNLQCISIRGLYINRNQPGFLLSQYTLPPNILSRLPPTVGPTGPGPPIIVRLTIPDRAPN